MFQEQMNKGRVVREAVIEVIGVRHMKFFYAIIRPLVLL